MANVTHIRQAGNLLLAGYDDGTELFAYPTTGGLWIKNAKPSSVEEILPHLDFLRPGRWVDWIVNSNGVLVLKESHQFTDYRIHTSSDGGETWTQSTIDTSGASSANGRLLLRPYVFGDTVFLLSADSQFMNSDGSNVLKVSHDNGQTFANVDLTPAVEVSASKFAVSMWEADGTYYLSYGNNGGTDSWKLAYIASSSDGNSFNDVVTDLPLRGDYNPGTQSAGVFSYLDGYGFSFIMGRYSGGTRNGDESYWFSPDAENWSELYYGGLPIMGNWHNRYNVANGILIFPPGTTTNYLGQYRAGFFAGDVEEYLVSDRGYMDYLPGFMAGLNNEFWFIHNNIPANVIYNNQDNAGGDIMRSSSPVVHAAISAYHTDKTILTKCVYEDSLIFVEYDKPSNTSRLMRITP